MISMSMCFPFSGWLSEWIKSFFRLRIAFLFLFPDIFPAFSTIYVPLAKKKLYAIFATIAPTRELPIEIYVDRREQQCSYKSSVYYFSS